MFYTDGLIEARDRAGRYFQLRASVDTLRRASLDAAADELLDRLRAHTGRKLDDDVALLLFEAASPAVAEQLSPSAGAARDPMSAQDLVTAGPGP